MPAIAPPRMKVKTTTLSTSMPISAAASPSSDTARIAVPIFVRCTIRYRPAMKNTASTITSASTRGMWKPATSKFSRSRKNDTPMAQISGASPLTRRNGR